MGALDTNIQQTLKGYNDEQLRSYIDGQRDFLRQLDTVLREKESLLRELNSMVDIEGNPVPPSEAQISSITENFSRILFGNPQANNPTHPDYQVGVVKKMPSIEIPPSMEDIAASREAENIPSTPNTPNKP